MHNIYPWLSLYLILSDFGWSIGSLLWQICLFKFINVRKGTVQRFYIGSPRNRLQLWNTLLLLLGYIVYNKLFQFFRPAWPYGRIFWCHGSVQSPGYCGWSTILDRTYWWAWEGSVDSVEWERVSLPVENLVWILYSNREKSYWTLSLSFALSLSVYFIPLYTRLGLG